MVTTKLLLRPPPNLFISTTPHLLSAANASTSTLSIRRRPLSGVASLSVHSQTHDTKPYGPSLHKGSNLVLKNPKSIDFGVIDEEMFTRVFDVLAIRVAARDCFLLEETLRGHLLNWPRIRNIARVAGDDVEEGFEDLVAKEEERVSIDVLDRRVNGKGDADGEMLSSVLYRDKLVKSFDANGFVNFRNVAKMSRPAKRNKVMEVRDGGVRNGALKLGVGEKKGISVAMVEVLEDGGGGNWSGLLGDGFCGGLRWRGPTRLLLLDESYASRDVEQLPEAIKNLWGTFGLTLACEDSENRHDSYCRTSSSTELVVP